MSNSTTPYRGMKLTPTDTLLERVYLLPDELVSLPQWVLWRQEQRGTAKPTKIPYQAGKPKRKAEADQPATWARFEQALEVFADHLDQPGQFTGIGFVFAPDDPFTGIDFDDCRTGDLILPDVREAIKRFGGYAEISPSMTGVKLWTRAQIQIPEGRTGFTRKGLFGCSKVEVYRHGRYFTVTGWRIDQ